MAEKRYESDLTKKEKRELEKQKLKSMSWKEKLGYIWAYYKPHMAVTLGIILLLSIVGQSIYRSRFETVFSVAILNGGMGDSEGMQADFKKYLGDEDKYHEIMVDSSMYFTGEDSADYTSVMKLTTLIGSNQIEAMVCTEDQYEKYSDLDAFIPMDELLGQEELEAYGSDVDKYGILVNDSPKLTEFGMETGSGDAYLAVFAYTEHLDNAKAFIKYMKEENHG